MRSPFWRRIFWTAGVVATSFVIWGQNTVSGQESGGESTCLVDAGWHRSAAPYAVDTTPAARRPIAISLSTGRKVLIGGESDLFVTEDCGKSWSNIANVWKNHDQSASRIVSLAVESDERIYIGFGSNLVSLDKVSTDHGLTWISMPIVSTALASSVSQPGTVYGIVDMGQNAGFVGVGRTVNGGESWERWSPVLGDQAFRWLQYSSLAVNPVDSNMIYMTIGKIILKSEDSGRTFTALIDMDANVQAFAVSRDGSIFWAYLDSGVLFSGSSDLKTWQPVTLPDAMRIAGLAASPHDAKGVYIVSTDGYVWTYREPHASTLVLTETPQSRVACPQTTPWLQVPSPTDGC